MGNYTVTLTASSGATSHTAFGTVHIGSGDKTFPPLILRD
jgi:hypothetical protein